MIHSTIDRELSQYVELHETTLLYIRRSTGTYLSELTIAILVSISLSGSFFLFLGGMAPKPAPYVVIFCRAIGRRGGSQETLCFYWSQQLSLFRQTIARSACVSRLGS